MIEDAPGHIHLIYLRSGLVLSRRPYPDWRAVQDTFEDYMTSLGPWTEDALCDYFAGDFGPDDANWPLTRAQLAAFIRSDNEELFLTH